MSAKVFVDGGWIGLEIEDGADDSRQLTQALTVMETLNLAADLVEAAIGDELGVTKGCSIPDLLRGHAMLIEPDDTNPERLPAMPNGTEYSPVGE